MLKGLPRKNTRVFNIDDLHTHMVLPGEHLVVSDPRLAVSTLLGSCVAACIRDTRSGIGGLNHFLLPGSEDQANARYGVYAMEVLINDILARGAMRENLEAKVFGGGAVIASAAGLDIGRRNGDFVKSYLSDEKITIAAEDLGGTRGRRLYYYPATGDARVQYLDVPESQQAAVGEARLGRLLEEDRLTGTVELFG